MKIYMINIINSIISKKQYKSLIYEIKIDIINPIDQVYLELQDPNIWN